MTITFPVDSFKISHQDKEEVNNRKTVSKIYIENVRMSWGVTHHNLGTILKYTQEEIVQIGMADYLKKTISAIIKEVKGYPLTSASDHLFNVIGDDKQILLGIKQTDAFHTSVER